MPVEWNCIMPRKWTHDKFVEYAKKIHENKYDYSVTKFHSVDGKIQIGCPEHGVFVQLPSNHIQGKGCPECKRRKAANGIEIFIKKSRGIHGNKYNYDKVVYTNNCSMVKIVCDLHGEFEQEPRMHISGRGCPMCGRSRTSKPETNFLDCIGIPKEDRQVIIKGTKLQVDGLERRTNVIYEFLGDYWHGNPQIYTSETKILGGEITCGKAYENTFKRFDRLISEGYKIKYIWETDWIIWSKEKNGPIPIKDYKEG